MCKGVNSEKKLFEKKIKEWEMKYTNLSFTLLCIPSKKNNTDNNLLVVCRNSL